MPDPEQRPHLSYVLAAANAEEVHKVAAWLRQGTVPPDVEIVLAAPGQVFGHVAARTIPDRVITASADPQADRKAIRVAGARVTSGLIVIAVDCDDDIAARMRDPFEGEDPSERPDPATWSEVELPRAEIGWLGPGPSRS
jgi:hypothetical protein